MDEIEREKQVNRDADEQAVASRQETVEQLEAKNGLFQGHWFKVDFTSARRLW